jgi:aminopeptidase-like protein
MTRPELHSGSEAWTIRGAGEKRLLAPEQKFTRTVGYIPLHLRQNEDILENLKTGPIIRCIKNYHTHRKQHVRGV